VADDLDPQPIRPRRYTNGNSAAFERRKHETDWKQLLVECGFDVMSLDERLHLRDRLIWAKEREDALKEQAQAAKARRIVIMALIGAAATMLSGFGAFLGGELANTTRASSLCPAGLVCSVATPVPRPTSGTP